MSFKKSLEITMTKFWFYIILVLEPIYALIILELKFDASFLSSCSLFFKLVFVF